MTYDDPRLIKRGRALLARMLVAWPDHRKFLRELEACERRLGLWLVEADTPLTDDDLDRVEELVSKVEADRSYIAAFEDLLQALRPKRSDTSTTEPR